ncbi:MAG: flagellar biosynthesis protein FlgD [Selenomonadaceae bacterium]|nr:flagellar biosynthesis protein FlgD [Selenomonadaceae bacterium]
MANSTSLNTITVDGVTYNAAAYEATQTKETKKNDDLGKEAFLQLLVAQLKNQDPLDPQDNSSYIAELAQFSALEQMTNVSSNLENLSKIVGNIDTSVLVGQLSSMIGKNIDWVETINEADADGNPISHQESMSGVVSGVVLVEGNPNIVVESGGEKYIVDIANIGHVYETAPESTAESALESLVESIAE